MVWKSAVRTEIPEFVPQFGSQKGKESEMCGALSWMFKEASASFPKLDLDEREWL